jgi:hypothetical protein
VVNTDSRIDQASRSISGAALVLRAVALLAFALLCARFARGELIDDAFISFRYAHNWLEGQGLVFNPGERVEGYTNFAWTLLLAGAARVGLDFELSSRLLGAAFGLAAVGLLSLRRRDSLDTALPLAALLLGSDAAFALWSVHGLETAMFSALVLAALLLDLAGDSGARPRLASASCWALAALTRPEGALLAVARAMYGFALTPSGWRTRAGLRWVALLVGIVGAHLAWRLWFYGDVVPNTFHAKVGGGTQSGLRGLAYLADFFALPGGLVFAPALALAGRLRRDPALGLVAAVVSAGLVAIVLEGGDAFPAWRFCMPLLPLLYLLTVAGTLQLWRLARERHSTMAVAVGVAAAVCVVALHAQRAFEVAGREARGANAFTATMKLVGEALRDAYPPGTTIALNPAGAVPFVSGLPAIDMLGLNDREIARAPSPSGGSGLPGHERGDGAAVLRRNPEIILLGNVYVVEGPPEGPPRFQPVFRSERELVRSPELLQRYTHASLPLADGRFVVFLQRRDMR